MLSQGLDPEIVPSTFEEDFPHEDYKDDLSGYPVATAGEKGREVYERLVREDPEDAPELVISGTVPSSSLFSHTPLSLSPLFPIPTADTIVLFPPQKDPNARVELGDGVAGSSSVILEKPSSKGDNVCVPRLAPAPHAIDSYPS